VSPSTPWLTATIARPSPRGYIHLPSRWWLRPNKLVYPDRTWDELDPIKQRLHMYTCRSGSIWVGNNWHVYRVHLNPDSNGYALTFPYSHPVTGIWYYGRNPVLLEPVTRLQLRMELLWTV
jgi:hypothetical protein